MTPGAAATALMKQSRFALLLGVVLAAAICAPRARAQLKPLASIELDCRAFAISSDGLTACAVFHQLGFKKTTIERDNVWTVTEDGKKRKEIVDGVRLVQTDIPFSFAIRGIAFSPNGDRLTLQMNIAEYVSGSRQDTKLIELMNVEGKEIPVVGTKTSVIENAVQGTWLADDQTVVYLLPSEDSEDVFQVGLTRPQQGKGHTIFNGHLFSAVAWDAAHNSAVAIERSASFDVPTKLVRLDLVHLTDTPLADLPAYVGPLALSPQGDKVAYFTDGDTLEIRDLSNPRNPIIVHCASGTFAWGPDGSRILLKRGPDKESNDIVWLSIPDGNLTPILHDLIFHAFTLSPDGRLIAVAGPGTNHVEVYPLH
jgi:WD40 repeat protein